MKANQLEMFSNVPNEVLSEITPDIEAGLISELNGKAGDFSGFNEYPEPEADTSENSGLNEPTGGKNEPLQEHPGVATQEQGSLNASNLINGKLAVQISDLILPALFMYVAEYFLNRKIDKKELQTTAAERNFLEPLFDAALKSLNIQVNNPVNALLIGLTAVYGTKMLNATYEKIEPPAPDYEALSTQLQVPNLKIKSKAPTTEGKRGRGRPRKN